MLNIVALFLSDSPSAIAEDFADLGTLLLGGFATAVVVALAFAFIKLRLTEKKEPAEFISISDRPKKRPSSSAS